MDIAKFGKFDRQIAVRLQPMLENLHMSGAVHRLERKNTLIRFRIVRMRERMRGFHREHVFLIPAPVA